MIKSILLAAMAAGSVAYAASFSSSVSKTVIDLNTSDVFVDLRALCKTDSPWTLLPSFEASQRSDFRYLGTVPSKGDVYLYFVADDFDFTPLSFEVAYSDSVSVDSSTGLFIGDDVVSGASIVSSRQNGSYSFYKCKIPSAYNFLAGESHRFSPKSVVGLSGSSRWAFDGFFSDLSWNDAASGLDVVSEYYSDNYAVIDDKSVDLAAIPYVNVSNADAKRVYLDGVSFSTEYPNSAHELYYCFFNLGDTSRSFSSVSRVDFGFGLYSYDFKYRLPLKGIHGVRTPRVYTGTDDVWQAPLNDSGNSVYTYPEHSPFNVSSSSYVSGSATPSIAKFSDVVQNNPLFHFNFYKALDYSYSDLIKLDLSSIDACGGSDVFKSYLKGHPGYQYAFRVFTGDRYITDWHDSYNNPNDYFNDVQEVVTHCQGVDQIHVFRLGFKDTLGLSFDLNAIDEPCDVSTVTPIYNAETHSGVNITWVSSPSFSWWDAFVARLVKYGMVAGIVLATVIGLFGGLFLSSKISSIVSSESSDKKGRS